MNGSLAHKMTSQAYLVLLGMLLVFLVPPLCEVETSSNSTVTSNGIALSPSLLLRLLSDESLDELLHELLRLRLLLWRFLPLPLCRRSSGLGLLLLLLGERERDRSLLTRPGVIPMRFSYMIECSDTLYSLSL